MFVAVKLQMLRSSFHPGNRPYLKTALTERLYQSYLGAGLLHVSDAENLPHYIGRAGSDVALLPVDGKSIRLQVQKTILTLHFLFSIRMVIGHNSSLSNSPGK